MLDDDFSAAHCLTQNLRRCGRIAVGWTERDLTTWKTVCWTLPTAKKPSLRLRYGFCAFLCFVCVSVAALRYP